MPPFISIDQNSTPLWDTIPKLDALLARGARGTHYLEDIDIAFTAHGARVGDAALALTPERYYRGGSSDWGAAWFYSDFLGRLPIDVRDLEPYTGWSTAALSRRLGLSVDALYDLYSPSDNWQLVGPSYAGDTLHHRVIGDLTAAETAEFLHALMAHAEKDLLECLPEAAARTRIRQWFRKENTTLDGALRAGSGGTLVDVYNAWLRARFGTRLRTGLTSALFALPATPGPTHRLLSLFVREYGPMSRLYNEAVRETGVGVSPLNSSRGDLPMFVVFRRGNRLLRSDVRLEDGWLHAGGCVWKLSGDASAFPFEAMRADDVCCLAGKALLLVLQARDREHGGQLALPHQGSLYMPAARTLEKKLVQIRGSLDPLHPVIRVRLHFFDHWAACSTVVRAPAFLHDVFPAVELPAREFAEVLRYAGVEAREALSALRSDATRTERFARLFEREFREREELETRRRNLARNPETRSEAKQLWGTIKQMDRGLLQKQVEWILSRIHLLNLEYYDSRGALLPWCVALGGDAFYRRVVENAEIYIE